MATHAIVKDVCVCVCVFSATSGNGGVLYEESLAPPAIICTLTPTLLATGSPRLLISI